MALYNQKHIQDFYNTYGEKETERWNKSIVEQVKLLVHQHYLNQYIAKDDVILELGAGTGIFTKELAKRSANLIVTDLSPVQLKLNKEKAISENYAHQIKDWAIRDICDLSEYEDERFDKVVCYGGPLSYVFERKLEALAEIKRVLKPGGIALLSVMNLLGTIRERLDRIILPLSISENEKVMQTGNLHPSSYAPSDHYCHIFRSEELRLDIKKVGFKLVVISASNCISTLREDELLVLKEQHPEKWAYFLDLEIRACKSPGMVESGTHIITILQK